MLPTYTLTYGMYVRHGKRPGYGRGSYCGPALPWKLFLPQLFQLHEKSLNFCSRLWQNFKTIQLAGSTVELPGP
jgi:hypothetical protein